MKKEEIIKRFESALNAGDEYAQKLFCNIEFTETFRSLGRLKSFRVEQYKHCDIEIVRDAGKVIICRIGGLNGDRVSKNFNSIAAAKRAINEWRKNHEPYWL